MKNVQVRFSDEAYRGLEHIAKDEATTLADIVRKGLQLYGILRAYRKEGKTLAMLDENRMIQAELIIPGITAMIPGNEHPTAEETETAAKVKSGSQQ